MTLVLSYGELLLVITFLKSRVLDIDLYENVSCATPFFPHCNLYACFLLIL